LGRLVKGDLDWIVMKCLEKDRSRRYETANGLARDVQRYRADESVEARPPSAGYRLSKLIRRNSRLVLATSVITLVLLGGIIGTCWGLLRATAALDSALRSERLATDQLFQALLNRARAGRFSGQMGQRLDSLVAVEQAARIRADERVRDEAIAAMALPDIRRVPVPGIPTPSGGAVAYGRQYSLYAWANRDGFISVRSIPDDHEIRRIASKPSSAAYFEFSPDDQFLLRFGVGRALRVWRVDDGRLALPDELRDCQAHAFSPDGRRLAVGREGWILHFDMATGREERRWRVPARAASLAFHPDSGQLAVGYDGSTVASVFGARGELVAELPVGAISAQVVTWHPDGKHLAISGSDPRIQIWEVAARRKLATLTGHVKQVTALTFHPDGGLLASHSWDGVLRLWDPATGRPLLQLPLAVHDRPRFSGDGRWLGVALQGERAELLEVTPSREYRTLYSSAGADAGSYNQADISPDGRMLVVGIDGGTRLWDLRSGREIAALPAGTVSAFFEGGERSDRASTTPNGPRALLTSGPDGLQRWPITSADLQGELLRLGPPRQLSPLTRAWFARSPEGRTLAAVSVEGGVNHILDLDTATVRRELGVHPAGEVHALSGDGRWAASTGWHSDRVRLWNLDTGQMVHEWVLGKQNYACFTIDSRTLIIGRGDEYTFWDLATLQPIRRLPRDVAEYPGYVAFSPDGKLMALEMAPAVIHLKEVATGRTVAKLEDPHGDRATWQGFTPDSTQLVVVANYASAIHVWDLRAIRSRLKDMNLDWVWREFPPTATEHSDSEPQQIQVLPGDLPELTLERRTKQKIERWRRAVEANPDSADACNNLAWAYVTAPKPIRDVDSALPLAEKAVRLAAGNAIYRNTLGVAYYRAGRYREAVEVLRPNLMRQDDSCLALDLYFLAMTHHCLGETARARDFYDWAVRWTPLQRDLDAIDLEELAAFRAEAEEMLGVDGM
jgi:WD40 repeat protein